MPSLLDGNLDFGLTMCLGEIAFFVLGIGVSDGLVVLVLVHSYWGWNGGGIGWWLETADGGLKFISNFLQWNQLNSLEVQTHRQCQRIDNTWAT